MTLRRLVAYQTLLTRPDEVGGRGSRVTQRGRRDRWTRTLQPAVRAWLAAEIARHEGEMNGWQSATRARVARRPLLLKGWGSHT